GGFDAAIDDGAGSGFAQGDIDRQTQNGARVQGKLALVLAAQCHKAGIVRARGNLREPDLIAFDEQLDAEYAPATEAVRDLGRNVLSRLQRGIAHGLWLPAFDIVALDLTMADRGAEIGAGNAVHIARADGQ